MNRTMHIFALLALILVCNTLYAQIQYGGLPLPEEIEGASLRSSHPLTVEMPPYDFDRLRREDALEGNRVGGQRFAHDFQVSLSPDNAGQISLLADGTRVWRLHIHSDSAYSINLIFDQFELKGDARLFLYNPDRSQILGAFTRMNNNAHGMLATAPIEGDEVVVEYIEPKGAEGKLRVGSVNHDYAGLRLLPRHGSSLSCQTDVSCNDLHPEQRRSTVLIIVDGTEFCSGNLVNNTANDGTPFVLSASHCLFSNQKVIESKAKTSVFFFNYDTPFCMNNIQGNMEMSISGAEVVAVDASHDMLLLKLGEMPPVDYQPYYAGWNASEEVSRGVYCIHHPEGDVKKVSFEQEQPYRGTFTCNGLFNEMNHWIVDEWEEGLMQGGSSGSGLFDRDNLIVGNLSGGYTNVSCAHPGYDAFYMLSNSWRNGDERKSLSPWLDAIQSGQTRCDGREAYDNPCHRLSNVRTEDVPVESKKDEYAAGHNSHGFLRYAERFETGQKGTIHGLYFLPEEGTYSSNDPVTVMVFSGDSVPEKRLCQQTIKITNNYFKATGSFSTKTLTTWSRKENYVRLNQPVQVDSTFFVVFSLPDNAEKKFALFHTRQNEVHNTAYFHNGTEWLPFNLHPGFGKPSSLMVSPVVQFEQPASSTRDVSQRRLQTRVYPNPVGEVLNIQFAENESARSITLYNVQGKELFHQAVTNSHCEIPLQPFDDTSLFILHVTYDNFCETLKIIRR